MEKILILSGKSDCTDDLTHLLNEVFPECEIYFVPVDTRDHEAAGESFHHDVEL